MEQIIRRSSEQKAKVASVLLFTDGLANRGLKTIKEIIDAMRDPLGSLARPGVIDNAAGARPLVSIYPYLACYILLLLIDSKTTLSNTTTTCPSPCTNTTTNDTTTTNDATTTNAATSCTNDSRANG